MDPTYVWSLGSNKDRGNMPDLAFQISGVEACGHSVIPLLQFKLVVANTPEDQPIHSAVISAQIQIQSAQRGYSAVEKEKLLELFGPPEMWGQTLRNRLWAQANVTVGAFSGRTEAILNVPCTCDLNLAATKYFRALEGGEASLLFLFSGSVFYSGAEGRLQVSPISWDKECVYRMSAEVWKGLMDRHYPDTEWLPMRRDLFEQLHACKRRLGLLTWEETLEKLLQGSSAQGNSDKATLATEEVLA